MITIHIRNLSIFVLTFLISFILLTSCKTQEAPIISPTLAQIKTQNNSVTTELIAPNETLSILWQLFEQLDSYPTANHSMYQDLIVNLFMSSGNNQNYAIDVDLMNQQLFISNGTTVKQVSNDLVNALLESPTFSALMTSKDPLPELIITHGEVILNHETTYHLVFKTYNDTVKYNSLSTAQNSPTTPFLIMEDQAIDLTFTRLPESLIQTTTNLDTLEYSESPINHNQLILPSNNGHYKIIVKAQFAEDAPFSSSGTIDYALDLIIDYPPSTYFISTNSDSIMLEPGDMTFIVMDHIAINDEIVVNSPFANKVDTFLVDNARYGIIATPSHADFDTYPVTVSIYRDTILIHEQSLSLTLIEKDFEVAHLYVTTSTAAVKTDDNAAKDQPFFDRAWASNIQEPLWEGAFIQPVEGRISTEYGVIRVTNDNWNNTRRHNALDIANTIGTPILAANSGKVVCANPLNISGNTVIIDHGMGFYSIYFHLDAIYIELDSYVSKGDTIGTMGTTGYSTGSHLHFAMRHNGIYLNPWSFFQEGYMADFSAMGQ